MDISALNAASYPPVAPSARPVRDRTGREASGAVRREQPQAAPDQADRTREEALRMAREAQREREVQGGAAGNIQFVDQDGTRVMKVMDRKDVLIYQVPTKGELALVKSEESGVRRMLALA